MQWAPEGAGALPGGAASPGSVLPPSSVGPLWWQISKPGQLGSAPAALPATWPEAAATAMPCSTRATIRATAVNSRLTDRRNCPNIAPPQAVQITYLWLFYVQNASSAITDICRNAQTGFCVVKRTHPAMRNLRAPLPAISVAAGARRDQPDKGDILPAPAAVSGNLRRARRTLSKFRGCFIHDNAGHHLFALVEANGRKQSEKISGRGGKR